MVHRTEEVATLARTTALVCLYFAPDHQTANYSNFNDQPDETSSIMAVMCSTSRGGIILVVFQPVGVSYMYMFDLV